MRTFPTAQPDNPAQILMVDDNIQGLRARKSLLQEHGYRISIATNGEEALELFSKHKFDVIVTDYKMPRMDGQELIRRIRTLQAGARIIMLSGFVDLLGLNEESTGADVVIPKSASEVTHLARSVKRLLNQPARKPVNSAKGLLKAAARNQA